MYCMKCGRDIEEDQVFCDTCLEVMKKYPVKPGTAIQLPGRKDAHTPRRAQTRRRQSATAEEQILRLKKRLRGMFILWLVTLLLLAVTIYPTVEFFLGRTIHLPGQNYTTITSTDTEPPQISMLP